MAIIYGVTEIQTPANPSNLRYDTLGKDSEVIAVGDPLSIQSGVLSVATAVQNIVGIAAKKATMGATNDTVYPPYIPISLDAVYLMGSNGDFTDNETDGGTYYKITGTTGVVQVDQASGVQTTTNRIVEIVKVDPFNEGGSGSGSGLRKVYVKIVKNPAFNLTTT